MTRPAAGRFGQDAYAGIGIVLLVLAAAIGLINTAAHPDHTGISSHWQCREPPRLYLGTSSRVAGRHWYFHLRRR